MINLDIDYFKLRVPTYESKFSRVPHFRNNKNDSYICTASFTEEYMEKVLKTNEPISRSMTNMEPAFFVYEFDTLSIAEQKKICESLLNDPKFENRVFSQTFSGSKSIHTLIPIDPRYRKDIMLDFKYYWGLFANIFFGSENLKYLDSQCASIGRLSRNPNGVRENGVFQECYYYNPNATLMRWGLDSKIKEHNKQIEEMKRAEEIRQRQEKKVWVNNYSSEYEKLESLYGKGNKSEQFNLAYDVVMRNLCPKGANYIAAAASLKGSGFSREFTKNMLKVASKAHPTNISNNSIESILNKLYK